MKTLARIVGIGLLSGVSFSWPLNAQADVEVTAAVGIHATADFEVPLAAHGAWVEVRGHGRCWRPTRVAVDWRPYCDGRWVWTDCGWYWESDEPWAWACYHYGSWVHDSHLGWIWVPGIEWSPAWVHWRVGGGFIGWAPCPPHGLAVASIHFSFIPTGHFPNRVHRSSMVINDVTIINKTKEIRTIKRVDRDFGGAQRKIVINEGPSVAVVQAATGKELKAISIVEKVRYDSLSQARENKRNGQITGKKDQPQRDSIQAAPDNNNQNNSRTRPEVRPKKGKSDYDKPSRSDKGKDRASKSERGKGKSSGRGKP